MPDGAAIFNLEELANLVVRHACETEPADPDDPETIMIRTISVGSCVSIQGLFVSQLSDGKIVVKVDEKTFVGYPVAQQRAS